MENNLENKAKFFAQYWGQKVYIGKQGLVELGILQMNKYSTESGFLQLKTLSSITDEDAIEVAKLVEPFEGLSGWWTNESGERWALQIYKGVAVPNAINVSDYLRSKGYALPYMGLTVETMLEYGWIKLKEL